MKKKELSVVFVFGMLMLVGVSCEKKQANFNTDDVRMADIHHLVVNDDSTFTGELWDEGHRQCFELKDGEKTRLLLTHANGEKAIEYFFPTKSQKEDLHFYDENGKEITKKEFGMRYRQLIMEFGDN